MERNCDPAFAVDICETISGATLCEEDWIITLLARSKQLFSFPTMIALLATYNTYGDVVTFMMNTSSLPRIVSSVRGVIANVSPRSYLRASHRRDNSLSVRSRKFQGRRCQFVY